MSFSVGPGVAESIAANGDEARSDERFIIMEEGHKVSMTVAKLALYFWLQEDNAVGRVPFR
jgi:hypothetical protein